MAEKGESCLAVHLALISLVLLLTPSVPPLRNGQVSAAVTASRSRSRPRVKGCRWGRFSAFTEVIHVLNRASFSSAGLSRMAKV